MVPFRLGQDQPLTVAEIRALRALLEAFPVLGSDVEVIRLGCPVARNLFSK